MRYFAQKRIPPGGGNRKKPYKTNRKWGILLKSGFHLEAKIAKKPYKTNGKWGILSKREAGLRASLGQPAAGKKNGSRLAAMARPG